MNRPRGISAIERRAPSQLACVLIEHFEGVVRENREQFPRDGRLNTGRFRNLPEHVAIVQSAGGQAGLGAREKNRATTHGEMSKPRNLDFRLPTDGHRLRSRLVLHRLAC